MTDPNPKIPLPERKPDLIRDEVLNPPAERLTLQEWYPTDDEPGSLVLDRKTGNRECWTENSAIHQTFRNTHELGYLGMRPALQALGIFTSARNTRKKAYDEQLTMTYPSIERFCHAANALPRPLARYGTGYLQFEAWDGENFTHLQAVRALARGIMLLPNKGQVHIGILDHALAVLSIYPDITFSLQAKAKDLLAQAQLRNEDPNTSAPIQTLGKDFYSLMHVGTLHGFLEDDQTSLDHWGKFFKISNPVTAAHMQGRIRMHIAEMAELALRKSANNPGNLG
jgi:hypothetical protein